LYSGKTSFSSTAAGFHLGYSGSAYTFAIGNSGDSKSLRWDGNDLVIKGGTIIGSVIKSGDTGARFRLSAQTLEGYDAGNIQRAYLNLSAGILRVESDTSGDAVFFRTTGAGTPLRLGFTNAVSPIHANLKLMPVTNLPTNREAGSVCFYNGNLCIANGTHWFTFTGMNQLT
jgi:hypothetical protein